MRHQGRNQHNLANLANLANFANFANFAWHFSARALKAESKKSDRNLLPG